MTIKEKIESINLKKTLQGKTLGIKITKIDSPVTIGFVAKSPFDIEVNIPSRVNDMRYVDEHIETLRGYDFIVIRAE